VRQSPKFPDDFMTLDHTQRFAGRVDLYRRFRSRYPREVVDFLQERCGLTTKSVIADIGAGTGMLSELFLRNGNSVSAVEPNAEMRSACKELEATYPNLVCVEGTAERTGLADHSIDFVAAGRAFHWFDQEKCRQEFLRILSPSGWVVVLYLGRRKGPAPLLRDFEELLMTYGSDYASVRAQHNLESVCRKFFTGCEVHHAEYFSLQELSYEELEGQTLSFSVMPLPGDPRFEPMQRALQDYFGRYESKGRVKVPIVCEVYAGQMRHL
jgi:SAM-dependent methyltransferase